MGRNGRKTTLLKSLVRNAPGFIETRTCSSHDAASEWGHEVAVGYFAQDTANLSRKA